MNITRLLTAIDDLTTLWICGELSEEEALEEILRLLDT